MPDVRLIDGTELKKHIEITICYGCEIGHVVPPCGKCHVSAVVRHIDDMPEVDAHPVKHGKWESQCNVLFESCNVCKYINYDPVYTPNFCPNCGAKMDGGSDD